MMLVCRDIVGLVTDFVEGRLGLWDRVRFQLHLGMCVHCREFVRQMQLSRDSAGKMPPPELTPETRDELIRRFRDWKKGN